MPDIPDVVDAVQECVVETEHAVMDLSRQARTSFDTHAENVQTPPELTFHQFPVVMNALHHPCGCWGSYCDYADDSDCGFGCGAGLQRSSTSATNIKYATITTTIFGLVWLP